MGKKFSKAATKKQDDAAWYREHFPTQAARDAADSAVDKLDVTLPMTEFLDTWLAAYVAAGGKTKLKFH